MTPWLKLELDLRLAKALIQLRFRLDNERNAIFSPKTKFIIGSAAKQSIKVFRPLWCFSADSLKLVVEASWEIQNVCEILLIFRSDRLSDKSKNFRFSVTCFSAILTRVAEFCHSVESWFKCGRLNLWISLLLESVVCHLTEILLVEYVGPIFDGPDTSNG